MRRFILPVLLGIGTLGLLAAWTNPSPFRRVDVVREVDGERETWVIWFERWPVQHVERIPSLRVTDDFRASLRSSSIRLSASLEKAVGLVIRFRYSDRTEYLLSQDPSLLSSDGTAFFKGQLSNSRTLRSGINARLEGVCTDGRTQFRYQVYDRITSKHEVLTLFVPRDETRPVAAP